MKKQLRILKPALLLLAFLSILFGPFPALAANASDTKVTPADADITGWIKDNGAKRVLNVLAIVRSEHRAGARNALIPSGGVFGVVLSGVLCERRGDPGLDRAIRQATELSVNHAGQEAQRQRRVA